MAQRQLDEPVLQSAQDALIGEGAAPPREPATPRTRLDWRGATGRHPLAASLLALGAGALAAAWLKSSLSGRRQSHQTQAARRRFGGRA